MIVLNLRMLFEKNIASEFCDFIVNNEVPMLTNKKDKFKD